MSEDREQRRLDALERIAERSERLSGVTSELLDELRNEAHIAGAEAATIQTADARLEERRRRRRGFALVLLAVVMSMLGTDWHTHAGHNKPIEDRLVVLEKRAGIEPVPPTAGVAPMWPSPMQRRMPIGPIFVAAALVGAALAWVEDVPKRGRNGRRMKRNGRRNG